MKPSTLKKALRAQLADRARSVAAARRQLRADIAKIPLVRDERRRRRIRRAVWIAAGLILLCFLRCDCSSPGPVDEAPSATAEPIATPRPTVLPRKKPVTLDARTSRQRRGEYALEANPSPDWLEAFRLQVGARSPKLARCFTGQERPGALRWTSALNAVTGDVSDHVFEPVVGGLEPTTKQRECAVAVLSSPRYRLPASDAGEPLPDRISIVIEF
jgi:hypothetical protein